MNAGQVASNIEAPPANLVEDREHIASLDGIRGLAILAVLIAHLAVLKPQSPVDTFFASVAWTGWIGVDLFFVLSGFLITGILLDSKTSPNFFRNFYGRRVLRIFPLYYLVVFVSVVVLPQIPHPKANNFGRISGDEIWYWLYLSNFSIAFRERLRHGILDVSWSLAIEEQFYLVWPAIVWMLTTASVKRLALALVVFSAALRIVMVWRGVEWWYTFYLTPCRMDSLALGAWAACTFREREGRAKLKRMAPLFFSVGAVAFTGIWLREGGDLVGGVFKQSIGFTCLGVASLGLLGFGLSNDETAMTTRLFRQKFLLLLGKYSYALYLLNLPLRAVVRDLVYPPANFMKIGNSVLPGQLLFYVIAFPVVFAGAWLSWHMYEKHFLKLKRFFPSQSSKLP